MLQPLGSGTHMAHWTN